jgi:hypothetical protein
MRKLDAVALALAIVGALNWGRRDRRIRPRSEDLGMEFGETSGLTRVVYGLSAPPASGWRSGSWP